MQSFGRALRGASVDLYAGVLAEFLAELLAELLVELLVELRAEPLVEPLTQFWPVLYLIKNRLIYK